MAKIEKFGFATAILVEEGKVPECDRESIRMNILLSSKAYANDKVLLSYVFEKETDKTIFLFKLGTDECFFPVAYRITGTKQEVRKKIVEFARKPKLSIQAIPFEGGALMLVVFETAEEADKASEETQ